MNASTFPFTVIPYTPASHLATQMMAVIIMYQQAFGYAHSARMCWSSKKGKAMSAIIPNIQGTSYCGLSTISEINDRIT